MTGPPLSTYEIKWFKAFYSHSVFLKLFIPTALKARTGNYNAGTQPITPHFSPRQYPKWKRNIGAASNSVRSQQKKSDRTSKAFDTTWGLASLWERGLGYQGARCKTFKRHYPSLPTVKSICRQSCAIIQEPCLREKAPQVSPIISLPTSNFWLGPNFRFSNPVSVLTPFGRFFTISRDMANCPTALISARIGSDYHHQLSRYRCGRRHLWQAGTKSRAGDVARLYGSRRAQRPTQGSYTL